MSGTIKVCVVVPNKVVKRLLFGMWDRTLVNG